MTTADMLSDLSTAPLEYSSFDHGTIEPKLTKAANFGPEYFRTS